MTPTMMIRLSTSAICHFQLGCGCVERYIREPGDRHYPSSIAHRTSGVGVGVGVTEATSFYYYLDLMEEPKHQQPSESSVSKSFVEFCIRGQKCYLCIECWVKNSCRLDTNIVPLECGRLDETVALLSLTCERNERMEFLHQSVSCCPSALVQVPGEDPDAPGTRFRI